MTVFPRWLRHALRVCAQLTLDAAAVWGAYRCAYEIRFHWKPWLRHFPIEGHDPGWELFARIMYVVVPLWLGIFWYATDIYTRPWMLRTDRFLRISKGAVLSALATLSGTFIYARLEYSRQMLLLAVPLAVIFVSLAENLVLWLDGWIARFESTSPVLIIGGDSGRIVSGAIPAAHKAAGTGGEVVQPFPPVSKQPNSSRGKVAELLRENLLERHPGIMLHELPEISSVERVMQLIQSHDIGEIILIRSSTDHEKILELAEACESADVGFKMIPDLLELRLGEVQMDDSLGIPAYRIQHTSLSPANRLVKRVFDIVLSLAVLTLASIPWAAIAILIRLNSKGPVFYRQKRLGYKGQVFEAYKFRTMISDAEARLQEVRSANDQKGGFFKAKEDPRVTSVGRWLRRFSLDEFPQFLNVLLGEMSVVGPRPLALTTGEMEELLKEFGSTAKKRLNILPGITGLWQVSGRSDVSSTQRFALDLFYIEHWSLGLDLQIILKTIPAMLSAKGAY